MTGRAYYETHGWSGCAGSSWDRLTQATRDGWEAAAREAAARAEVWALRQQIALVQEALAWDRPPDTRVEAARAALRAATPTTEPMVIPLAELRTDRIRLNPTEGFVVTLTDGQEFVIPADGSPAHWRRCSCHPYTIRTDYGTGTEHDVDRSSCPIHGGADDAPVA